MRSITFPAEMITARIAFNLHYDRPHPVNQPFRNPYSPISRPFLRFRSENAFPVRFRRIHTACCTANSFDSAREAGLSTSEITEPSGAVKIANHATWLGVATLTNKIMGLLREGTMASVFGVGAVATAFKYAWVLPGFSSLLLGGVNGPIHIIMSATLSKLPMERGKKLFQHLTTIMFLVGGVVATLVYIFPECILHIYAPGLWILTEGKMIRELAIEQLKIMTPCIVLAGPVGLGFGYLSAEGNDVLPSISPAISSSLLIVACLLYNFTRHLNASSTGGKLLSFAASLGLVLQWVIQAIVLRGGWPHIIPDSFSNLKGGDVCEFFSLLLPATASSGLAQIASFTDLCFASHIPDAASGLSYAYLMVMAPLGALSSIIILPLVPTFGKFVKTSSWKSLGVEVERSLLLCMVLLLPTFSIMRVLAEPAFHVFFKYFALDSSASAQVSALFSAYSIGAPFFFARDLLVAVFYAFGDGKGPFLVSAGAIALNAFLDWLSVSKLNLGAEGLALSTSFIASMSVFLLFHLLKMKLSELSNYTAMFYPATLLLMCSITSNLTTSAGYKLIRGSLASTFLSRYEVTKEVLTLSIASFVGFVGFFLPALLLHLTGFELVRNLYRMLIKQQSLRPVTKSFNSKEVI